MKWDLYDDLIEAIPGDVTVRDCVVGLHWVAVESAGVGLAGTPFESRRPLRLAGRIIGMPVRELAQHIKSWSSVEAALGLAAINSALNTSVRAEELLGHRLSQHPGLSAFDHFREQYRGKRVAVIGHFPTVESLADVCQLSVLERRLHQGDFPDPACEYLLPEQDFVFITASTLSNKTLPRLLELSRRAFTVIVGPSTPISPVLFNYGVDAVAGSVVIDRNGVWRSVQEGGTFQAFKPGVRKVHLAPVLSTTDSRDGSRRG